MIEVVDHKTNKRMQVKVLYNLYSPSHLNIYLIQKLKHQVAKFL